MARTKKNPFEQAHIDLTRMIPLIVIGLLLLLIVVGLFTSIYTVAPEGLAVVKRFGRVIPPHRKPGLHFKLPFWIERAYFVPTERVLKEEFGFETVEAAQRSRYAKTEEHRRQSLMLTGDLNVVDVEWVVQFRIADPDKYLHRVRDPRETLRVIAEAVMRRIVGNRLASHVLTLGRDEIGAEAQTLMQEILDTYELGISVSTIELQDVTPPDRVKPAFNEVNEARQQKNRMINEAEKHRNQAIPRAEGEAQRLVSEAEGYSAQRINRAEGESARFTAILAEYRQAPQITRQRLYLETIDQVLPRVGRIYVVEKGGTGPIPLLNLGDGRRHEPEPGAKKEAR
ncbi:MAG: FtsH protease activity modulator HflK [Phycisphaeraceae bacterium]|nr:FtsH protease activity modulator HflK [Phycisphaeraceae bacterium]